METSDIPIFSTLRFLMQGHQERQRVLTQNVADADTPDYRRRDFAPPNFARALQTVSPALVTADPNHPTLAEVEQRYVLSILALCANNRTHAAKILGVSLRGLRIKLRRIASRGVNVPAPTPRSGDRHIDHRTCAKIQMD